MTETRLDELQKIAKRVRAIVDGFNNEAMNGVICTPPSSEYGGTGWTDKPNRTWCENCRSRWASLRALPDVLDKALSALLSEPPHDDLDPNERVHVEPRKVMAYQPVVTPRKAEPRSPLSEPEAPEAMHASAPAGYKCGDCTIDNEPCPTCYESAWRKRHPNVTRILPTSEPQAAQEDEIWWIALNGHGQIVGAYRSKEQAQENSNYVVGIKPKPAASPVRPAPPSQDDLQTLFVDTFTKLAASQRALDPAAAKVLYDNLWSLYDDSDPDGFNPAPVVRPAPPEGEKTES